MQFELLEECRYNDVLEYLKNHFHDEPLNVAVGLFKKGQTCELLENYDLQTMKDGYSLVAIDPETGKIAGAMLNGISRRGDVEQDLEGMKSIDDIKFHRLMGLLFSHNAEARLFQRYNVEKIFELRILSVDSDHRGKGLGQTLVKKSEELARQHGFTLLKADATSFFTQKILEKFGFETVKTIVYRDYKDDDGKLIYDTPSPHTTYKIMVKDLTSETANV
ncbi:arylalkylamine N-acetyltransferase-like 2 [Coccinella septempunctata]|uniref:arylalkylamine N-acetyltransferase-like 2 n=1 Tax=Coccinella septempunctata TaxID=41139 RepID=UPI001D05E2F3|nr:arylalkylamine N-acetyltransferase-like 2 [Coccinella septempunctata]XP_044749554.1 arylalkylamine N-acetyltransferase-like 2 [Coccinella septempunctata]XP_044749555.1 arylalkylamine N-acetyltransferase-like 2 [Coccinella septempunctata]XP_044749556.1 arylalkylamine N-acetyltransferase-like 2 [Coccinella septempunctata]